MNYQLIQLKTVMHPDPKMGGLTFFEGERDIPFAIKRFYYIYQTEDGIRRGAHAHKRNWQLLFCPFGSIEIIMDDGKRLASVLLDEPSKGLLLPPELWHEMEWHKTGSILCVAASECYDEEEYIRNYDDFLKFASVKENRNAL